VETRDTRVSYADDDEGLTVDAIALKTVNSARFSPMPNTSVKDGAGQRSAS
jgi:hypothetical protein